MSTSTNDALRAAAEEAGILDADMLQHGAFVGARTRYESREIGATEAISAMRSLRPAWFSRDWSRMDDREFSRRSAELLDDIARRAPRLERQRFTDLDAARLNSDEAQALDRDLRGVSESLDVAILEAAAARQKG